MKDQLEDYIRENREAFDDAVPSLKVWAAIDKELSTQTSTEPKTSRRFLSREVEDMKAYYETEIKNKEAQLVQYNERKNIAPDLAQIDQHLVPAGSEEQVINAMINSYQAKAAILEKVLENLKNKKSQTNKNNWDETNI